MAMGGSGLPFSDVDATKWNYFGNVKHKRKLPMDEDLREDLPAMKVLLTEEKMANQLSGLHLSTSYTSHGTAAAVDPSSSAASTTSVFDLQAASSKKDTDDWFVTPSSSLSRNGLPVLTICEEIKALQNKALPFLPHGIVDVQRPTKALVLWQPPVDDIGRAYPPRSYYNFGSAFSRREGIIFHFNARILSNVSTTATNNTTVSPNFSSTPSTSTASTSSFSTTNRIDECCDDDDDVDVVNRHGHQPPPLLLHRAIEAQTPAPSLDDLTSMTDAEMDNNNTTAYGFYTHSNFCR